MDAQLSFRRLEIFRLVVRERSVTRAAEILMIAQPAVSSQLRALESWLGATLFERVGNRLELTEAGRRTDAWARDVLAGAAQIRRNVGDLASGMGGGAVIWASMAVGTYLLPPVVSALRSQRHGADLTVGISQPAEAVRLVEVGEADFAVISWDRRALPDAIDAEMLGRQPVSLYMTPATAPAGRTMAAAQALSLPLIGPPRDAVYADLVEQMRAAAHLEPNFVIRLGHAEAIKRAALDHDWALFCPSYAVRAELAAGHLVQIDVPDLNIEEQLVLLARRDHLFSPLQRAVADAIRTALRDLPR
jgi:DNA-binding transcriptional LysR family regulator